MSTTSATSPSSTTDPLPVIIAGAGPCGLTAALTLQQASVPFVIYDRASAAKLCSNAGSGIDMAPCAVNILENELQVSREGLDRAMRPYEYMYMGDMDGKTLNTYRLKDMQLKVGNRSFGFANRSDLQHALLEELGLKDKDGHIRGDTEDHSVLHCSVAIESYENHSDHVLAKLNNGTSIKGSALLACDGIHSAVRKHMCRDLDDPLSYCGQVAWWGKTSVEKGSTLDDELKKIARQHNLEDGNVSYGIMGTRKNPGIFFSCEVAEDTHAWVYVLKGKEPPANASNDLTRRGGVALTGDEKEKEMAKLIADCPGVVKEIMMHASVDDVTRAGFFDRANMKISYIDGRVALLGDAAHPQSPMMGQGANMAIVDGYVAATRLVAAMKDANNVLAVQQALLAYDSKTRRKHNNTVIKKARKYGRWCTSKNRLTAFVMTSAVKYAPATTMVNDMVSGDKSNRKFVAAMKKDLVAAQ